MKTIAAKNPSEMFAVAGKLAAFSKGGLFVALFGGLGVGKTTFVRGFCSCFGIDEVSSPTFTIVKEYCNNGTRIAHFDCYRLGGEDELYAMGYEDYLASYDVVFMEWSELVADALPVERLEVHITGSGNEERKLGFKACGKKYEDILEAII